MPLGGGAALHARFQLEALLLTGQCIDPGARRREEVRRWAAGQQSGAAVEAHSMCTLLDLGMQRASWRGCWRCTLPRPLRRESQQVCSVAETAGCAAVAAVWPAAPPQGSLNLCR